MGCERPDPQTNADWDKRFERNAYEPLQERCVSVPGAVDFVAAYAVTGDDCYPLKEIVAVDDSHVRFVGTLAAVWHWSERIVPAWRNAHTR